MKGLILREKMPANPSKVYYHADCPDGLLCRMLWKRIHFDVDYIPYTLRRLEEIPIEAVFVDCSPHQEQIYECLKNGCIILEHNDAFKPFYHAFYHEFPGQIMLGEGWECAAHLVMRCLIHHKDIVLSEQEESIIDHIGMYDTRKKRDGAIVNYRYSRAISEYLRFFKESVASIDDLINQSDQIKEFGNNIETKQKELIRNAIVYDKIAFIFSDSPTGGAAYHMIKRGMHLIVTVQVGMIDNQIMITYSMRSDRSYNCAKIAYRNGGGGYPTFAKFTMPYKQGMDLIEEFLTLEQQER